MLVYWLMLAVPSIGALLNLSDSKRGRRLDLTLLFAGFLGCAMLIGLRDEIGPDWPTYQVIIDFIRYQRLSTALFFYDPAFSLTAWVATRLGWDIYAVNFVCGTFLSWGTFKLARSLPNPWLGLVASVPYLLIVVGMGYVRQAAAIGLVMVALVHLRERNFVRFLAALGGAMTFHVAAIVVVPVLGLAFARRYPILLLLAGLLGAVVFVLILSARLDALQTIYVSQQRDSAGTLIRLTMSAIPSLLFLRFRKSFPIDPFTSTVWTMIALVPLGLLPLLFVGPSSTLVDRIALFFSPIQIFVFGHITMIITNRAAERQVATLGVIAYSGAVLYIWLTYSAFAQSWVPYQWIL